MENINARGLGAKQLVERKTEREKVDDLEKTLLFLNDILKNLITVYGSVSSLRVHLDLVCKDLVNIENLPWPIPISSSEEQESNNSTIVAQDKKMPSTTTTTTTTTTNADLQSETAEVAKLLSALPLTQGIDSILEKARKLKSGLSVGENVEARERREEKKEAEKSKSDVKLGVSVNKAGEVGKMGKPSAKNQPQNKSIVGSSSQKNNATTTSSTQVKGIKRAEISSESKTNVKPLLANQPLPPPSSSSSPLSSASSPSLIPTNTNVNSSNSNNNNNNNNNNTGITPTPPTPSIQSGWVSHQQVLSEELNHSISTYYQHLKNHNLTAPQFTPPPLPTNSALQFTQKMAARSPPITKTPIDTSSQRALPNHAKQNIYSIALVKALQNILFILQSPEWINQLSSQSQIPTTTSTNNHLQQLFHTWFTMKYILKLEQEIQIEHKNLFEKPLSIFKHRNNCLNFLLDAGISSANKKGTSNYKGSGAFLSSWLTPQIYISLYPKNLARDHKGRWVYTYGSLKSMLELTSLSQKTQMVLLEAYLQGRFETDLLPLVKSRAKLFLIQKSRGNQKYNTTTHVDQSFIEVFRLLHSFLMSHGYCDTCCFVPLKLLASVK